MLKHSAFIKVENITSKYQTALKQRIKRMNQPVDSQAQLENYMESLHTDHESITHLNDKVPAHEFTVNEIEYQWYEGNYFKKVGESNKGDSFGELALQEKGGRRAATVRCEESDVHFATLTREEYRDSLQRIELRMQMETVQFLQQIPCFKTQSKKALIFFTKYLRNREFTRGQTVYSER